jgi:hypothetical protein
MTIYAIYTDKKIRTFINTYEEAVLQANLQENEQYIESDVTGNPSLFMVSEGQVVALPPMPEMGYEFNYDTLVWFNARSVSQQTAYVKNKRDIYLSESDWTVVKAIDTNTPIPTEWQTYRQELRDISQQSGYPFNVVWPTPPQG